MKTKTLILISALLCSNALASERTRVVLLGTGTPNAYPDRSGPAVAIVVDDQSYIIDSGPGVVRRAAALSPQYGDGDIEALDPENLKRVFLTHLHSDHTVGLPDLILTAWTLGRDEPLALFGPTGTADMAKHLLEAYDADIKYRLYGLEPANKDGWRVNAQEISEGVVYRDDKVKVEAFPVRHGTWPEAFGYRFTTPDKVIVISGDAAPSEVLESHAKGADILVHEVYSMEGFNGRDPYWQKYHSTNHTSAHELGELAERVQPQLLVLYHVLFWGASEETLLKEVREKFSGEVVLGNDLDIF